MGEHSLENLAKENIGEYETHRLEYVLETLDNTEILTNNQTGHSTIWKNLTIEELIGGLIEAENLLQRYKEANEGND